MKSKSNKKRNMKNPKFNQKSSNPGEKAASNPFEVHVNKAKFNILGRICQHDKGLPGVSRSKALQKRKQTLGKEFGIKHKSNEIRDFRIGRQAQEFDNELLNARFVAEQKSQMQKSNQVDLREDEILTHQGQAIKEIEEFRNSESDDDSEFDDKFDKHMTETTHFVVDPRQNRKSALEEMIAQAKIHKTESAKEKHETNELTAKLDNSYKQLIPLMGELTNSKPIRSQRDDYDLILREMVFEPRGAVSDRLNTDQELAEMEKERLEKLNSEKVARMTEGESKSLKPKPEPIKAEPAMVVYSSEGKLVSQDPTPVESDPVEEVNSGQSNDYEFGIEPEYDSYEDENDTPSDSDGSDLESEGEDIQSTPKTPSRNIKIPSNYEELKEFLGNSCIDDQKALFQQILTLNYPTPTLKNKKITQLFGFLLRYLNEIFTDPSTDDVNNSFKMFANINPFLYDLIHVNAEGPSLRLLKIIRERYSKYKQSSKSYPALDTLVFLKIVSNLYTTSDYRHLLVSPCYVFIGHILSKARIRARRDVAMGLFLVTLSLEYAQLSHRFIPAALNFLKSVFQMSIPKKQIANLKTIATSPFNEVLALTENAKNYGNDELLQAEDLVETTFSMDFKIRALNVALKLTKDAIELITNNTGSNALAEPFLHVMKMLDIDAYPDYVKSSYESAMASLLALSEKPCQKLHKAEKKVKALHLFEPRIEAIYDDKRRNKISKAKEEKVKMIHKIRRETKGAVREIRKDMDFLQKIQINQRVEGDRGRKEKVKRIYMEASVQQGELNEIKRNKMKK